MPRKRISDLPTKLIPDNTDIIPIVDTQSGLNNYVSKKTTVAGLLDSLAGFNVATTISQQISALLGAPDGIATLDALGQVLTAQLPPPTTTFVIGTVNDMLALSAEQGDVCVRTDLTTSFILTTAPATILGNWQELLSPSGVATSVNGYTGEIVLDYSDVGAAATVHTHVAADITDFTAAVEAATPPISHVHGNLDNDGAIGSTADLVVVTTASGVLGTAATISAATQVSGLATVATSGSASDIAAGTLPFARLATGTSGSTVCIGNDARLSDSRAPTSHVHGNISNAGAIGADAGLFVTTGADGVLGLNGPLLTDGTGVYTTGANAHIYTNGANASIFTNGQDAEIYTSGQYATIFTQGDNAYIQTNGTNAYIQTRSTFNLTTGTFVTTLSHAPTANRAIVFPDAAGTVALDNDARFSDTREWTGTTVSQAVAEAGTDTTRTAWTAQRVAQAIVALAPANNDIRADTVTSTTYFGWAITGSATSASVWRIRKTVYTGAGAVSSTTISATNVKWDDRLTTSYT